MKQYILLLQHSSPKDRVLGYVKIENSYIGPYTSISDNCSIIGSEVEYSIIMSGATICNVQRRIEASLLGNDVKINQSESRPRAHQIMIGDQGRIDFA